MTLKKLIYPLIITAVLRGMENEGNKSAINHLGMLPAEVHDTIAGYLPFPWIQPDSELHNALITYSQGYALKAIETNRIKVYIDKDTQNLILLDKKNNKSSELMSSNRFTDKVKSFIGMTSRITVVNKFALSPNQTQLIALTKTYSNRVCNSNGLLVIDLEKNTKKTKECPKNLKNLIEHVAIDNTGDTIAFADDNNVYCMNSDIDVIEIVSSKTNIEKIMFNAQGTKIAIMYNPIESSIKTLSSRSAVDIINVKKDEPYRILRDYFYKKSICKPNQLGY